VPVVKDSVVYGFLPFWRGPVPPKIDFSRFHRISVLAATMLDDGGWLRPNLVPAIDGGAERSTEAVWRGVTSRLANQALEHGTQLDLALRAPDVDTLRRLAERKLVDYSARTAVGLADTPLQGGHLGAIPLPEWKRLLWPVWNAPRHAFGGVTLILPPDLLAQSQPDANALAMGYVTAVIRAMQATGRPYVLNIVAPEGLALPAQADGQLPLEQRTFWENFLQMKKFAEPLKAHRGAQGVETPYSGGTDITVRLVIPLPESTKVTKKLLRANVEKPPSITGGDRAEILNSIVPVVFSPTGGETLSPDALHQLDDDMIYFKQNFAGIAIWPPPLKGAPSGDQTYSKLQSNFFGDHDYFCFTAFRLFWQCVAIAVFLYGLAVAILRPLDRRYAYAWWVGAALSVALGILILNFDPGLSEIASGNGLLFFVLAMALIGAGVGFAKPKVTPP
jgi:succinate dehydrogenase/fumarate reductase cytochrome b subunit